MRYIHRMPDDPADLLKEINWDRLRDDMAWTVDAVEWAHLRVETGRVHRREVYPVIADALEHLCKAQIAVIKGFKLESGNPDARPE